MDNQNLENLRKIFKIFQPQNIITSDEIDQVLKGIVDILATYKKGTESINKETKNLVEEMLSNVVSIHKDSLITLKEENKSVKEEIQTTLEGKLAEIEKMCKEIMDCKPEDGKDADEEEIVSKVLEQIQLPEYKETIITGETIIDKLNELDYSEENKIDYARIKNAPVSIKGKPFHTPTVLSNAVDLDGSTRADGYAITWDATRGRYTHSSVSSGTMAIGDSITSATQGSVLFAGASGVLTQDNASLFFNDTNNRLGLLTTAPTHTLTLGSTSTGISLYNTSDQTTNYERLQMYWNTNVFTIQTQKGGTGTNRNLTIGTVSRVLQFLESPTGTQGFYTFSNATGSSNNALSVVTTRSNSASVATEVIIAPTLTQTSTAGYTALLINPTETTVGSGTKNLILAQTGGVDKFSVSNVGLTTITNTTDSASLQVLSLRSTRATPTTNDEIYQSFNLNSSTKVNREMARISGVAAVVTNGSEQGRITFSTRTSGTLAARVTVYSESMYPTTTGATDLGGTGNQWGNLFLATTKKIDFANGDVVLTHSIGILTQTAGELRITSANVGTNADSVPTLSSTSTLTNKTISGASNTLTNIPVSAITFTGCKLTKSGAQSLGNNTYTAISFDGETYDTDTMHDNVTNNSRITFTTAGKYMIFASGPYITNNSALATKITLNATTTLVEEIRNNTGAGNETIVLAVAYQATAGDYVEFYGKAISGNYNANTSCSFSAYRIG